jgi:hypothetical protein
MKRIEASLNPAERVGGSMCKIKSRRSFTTIAPAVGQINKWPRGPERTIIVCKRRVALLTAKL